MADFVVALTGQAVQVVSGEMGVGWRISGALPMLVVHAQFAPDHPYRFFNFNIVLPKLQVSAYGGGVVAIQLPALQATMGITIPNNIRFNAQLPMLQGAVPDVEPATTHAVWTGSVGMVWSFRIKLPLLQTSGRFGGWRFAATLPALEGAGSGGSIFNVLGNNSLTFDIRLPRLKAHAEFSTAQPGYRFFVLLPALAAVHGLAADVKLPMLRVSARFTRAQLPSTAGIESPYGGWAMNLQNMAVTEFSNFPFRAMACAYNEHYAIGFDGNLYRMGGDRDYLAPIPWAWESGLSDFGVNAQKGLLALYVDGLFDNTATFSIQTDTARRVYGHRAKGNVANHQPHRIPLGKGVRTRNIGIGMADAAGGYLELDKITPEYVITTRNI